MALYKYLTLSKLPNPNSSLSKQLPSSMIAFANSEVSKVYSVQESSGNGKTHGPFLAPCFTLETDLRHVSVQL